MGIWGLAMKDHQTTSNVEAYAVSPMRSYVSADHLPPYYSQSLRGISPEDLAAKKRTRMIIIGAIVAACIALVCGIIYSQSSQPAAASNAQAAAVQPVNQPSANEIAERTAKAREAVRAAEAAAKSAEAAAALAAAQTEAQTREDELSTKIAHLSRVNAIDLADEHVKSAWLMASTRAQTNAPASNSQPAKKTVVKPKSASAPSPVVAAPAPKKSGNSRPTDARLALPF